MSTNQRDAFEAWFSDNGELPLAVQQQGEGYRLMQAQEAWIAWNAAWQAATADTAALAASHARLLEAINRALKSDDADGPGSATETQLCEAANDPEATPVLREQAAALLQLRAAVAAAQGLTP